MHVATMVLLIMIAALGLIAVFTAPKMIGTVPAFINTGTGLRTILLMGVILLWLIWFGANAESSTVQLLAALMVAERGLMLIRYAGWVGQVRAARTWVHMSVGMFWGLTDTALATLLLIFAW